VGVGILWTRRPGPPYWRFFADGSTGRNPPQDVKNRRYAAV